MKPFEMDMTLIRVTAVTGVSEFKGEERDHGCSVTFERHFDNTVLDEFDPDLRAALYQAEDGKPKNDASGQGEFAMPVEGVKLTARKCRSIQGPIKFGKMLAGWTIVYHYGASDQSAITAHDVRLSDFTMVEACDGGTVLMRFKAYQKLPPEVQGFVDHMAQTSIECTFKAPPDQQVDFVEEQQKTKRGRKKTAAEKAGSADDPFAGSDLARGAENGPKDGEDPPEGDEPEPADVE